jgi:colicin import membrane protein
MRGNIFITLLVMVSFVIPNSVFAQSFEDELMIETETAIADSEAAMQEAKEAEKIAAEESRRSQVEITKAQRELERARQEEAKAKRDIARAERDRTRALEETEKARLEAETAKQQTLMAKDELNQMMMKLEDSKAEQAKAEEDRRQVMETFADVKKELEEMKLKLEQAKKEELAAVKSLSRAEMGLKDLQDKATITYKNADQDRAVFIKAVSSHRDTLRKISKKLDELEIEVETDKSFYDKQRRTRLTRTLGSTISSTNTKVAKVMTSGCNIRSYPSLSSEVVGKRNQGQKLKVRKYNKGWYSVIVDGQKAFMGAGCFQ